MGELNITVHRQSTRSPELPREPETPYDKRYGFWGLVTELHPENHTVHVRTDTGRTIANVRVASDVWVTINEKKDFPLSGKRNMPPIDTYVLVFMPTGEYSSAVVIASGFSDDPKHGEFKPPPKDEEEKEEARHIEKAIDNAGWTTIEDKRTGTKKFYNAPPDLNPTIKLEIDYGTEKEPLDPPELHAHLFHDEENNDPGIKLDIVSGKTIDMAIFDDLKLNHTKGELVKGDLFDGEATFIHKKGDSTVIKTFDTEITIKKEQLYIKHKGHTKLMTTDLDIESDNPMGFKGTNTQLGGGVLQKYWSDEINAIDMYPLYIPPIDWPMFVPVPPAPPLMNMATTGREKKKKQAAKTAKSNCKKALK